MEISEFFKTFRSPYGTWGETQALLTPDLSPLEEDIRLKGIRTPLVVDRRKSMVLDGCHRALVARNLGLKEISISEMFPEVAIFEVPFKLDKALSPQELELLERVLESFPLGEAWVTGEIFGKGNGSYGAIFYSYDQVDQDTLVGHVLGILAAVLRY